MDHAEAAWDNLRIFYCTEHPDFEGLDFGKFHDHLEKNHPQLLPTDIHRLITESDFRRSDMAWIARTWGRPPKLASQVADSEIEKKR
jgi:hypothetical protein